MFYISSENSISYEQLIVDLNQTKLVYKQYFATSYRDFIVNVINALINNIDLELVDYRNIEGDHIKPIDNGIDVNNNLQSIDELIYLIHSSISSVGIYSSGTEGPPKLIYQTIQRLLKSVQSDPKYLSSHWAFTYNPSHSAGIQVFLQVIVNKACLCDFYKCSRAYILSEIERYKVKFISGTPTFYRMLAPYDFSFDYVESITLNGEKSTSTLIDSVKNCFPNARVRNIYGSTESGPLMSSESSDFIVPDRLKDKVKILDDELFIHSSIMSSSVANQEWYPTGDMVVIVANEPITLAFISRKSRIINVGGQNVNPQEIEEQLLLHHDIQDAQVIPRENKLIGNVITASIITVNSNLKEKDIIDYLKQKLAHYKVPRIIIFVSELSIGRTGKKNIK